jgi:hypothetical protein
MRILCFSPLLKRLSNGEKGKNKKIKEKTGHRAYNVLTQ